MSLCELIRKEKNADRMFCLYPYREANGLVQACTIAYNRATTIDLRFFDEKYGVQVWIDTDDNSVHYYPGIKRYGCFTLDTFCQLLWRQSKEAYFTLLYSLFFNMKKYDAAYVAAQAAYDAAYDAYTPTAHAAYATARDAARDARDAARDAAYVAYDATYVAFDAYVAYDAYTAVADAAYDAAYAVADVAREAGYTAHVREALRALFKFRKEVLKNDR